MRSLPLLLLLASALPAPAQEARVDTAAVRACHDSVPVGGAVPDCVGDAADVCADGPEGRTTLAISECLMAETAAWDAMLNEVYQRQMADLAAQAADLPDQLRAAQRAWIAFRDAECGLQYGLWQDGSMRVIVAGNCQLSKTAERTLELRDLGAME